MADIAIEWWIDGETADQFAVRIRSAASTLLADAIPGLTPDQLCHLLSPVLRDMYRARPRDPRIVIENHARLAAAAISCNEHQRGVESVVDLVRPELIALIAKRFGSTGLSWDNIEQAFVRRLGTVVLRPDDPDATLGLCKTIATNLVLDLLRKKEHLRTRGDIDLSHLPDRRTDQVHRDPPRFKSDHEVRMELAGMPFLCPPNLPHESLAWALVKWRGMTPRKLVEMGPGEKYGHVKDAKWVELPLRRILQDLMRGLVGSKFSYPEWCAILKQMAAAMDQPLAAVLKESNYKARQAYERLLSHNCGETCWCDYISTKRSDGAHHSNAVLLKEETLIRIGAIEDWVEAVNRRVLKLIIRALWYKTV